MVWLHIPCFGDLRKKNVFVCKKILFDPQSCLLSTSKKHVLWTCDSSSPKDLGILYSLELKDLKINQNWQMHLKYLAWHIFGYSGSAELHFRVSDSVLNIQLKIICLMWTLILQYLMYSWKHQPAFIRHFLDTSVFSPGPKSTHLSSSGPSPSHFHCTRYRPFTVYGFLLLFDIEALPISHCSPCVQ